MIFARSDAARLPLADKSVDLVFTSPPYLDARTYGIRADRRCEAWVEWMLGVVGECCRVSRGLVLINCAGVTRDWCYQPGPEMLLSDWYRKGGMCWRPAYMHRVGIPGSGHKHWLRSDVEYVLAFVSERGATPWADNTAMGHAPKWAPGGEMSHRLADGDRRNQWGGRENKRHSGRRPDGSFQGGGRPSHLFRKMRQAPGALEVQGYLPPAKANPGNLVKVHVGGNQMGHSLAHDNEAPFPEDLARFFLLSFCPPGGIVLDPFSGSGTTVSVAERNGRHGIGLDLRQSQCELGRRRTLLQIEEAARPHKARARRPIKAGPQKLLFKMGEDPTPNPKLRPAS
jgi:hypothetical protein